MPANEEAHQAGPFILVGVVEHNCERPIGANDLAGEAVIAPEWAFVACN